MPIFVALGKLTDAGIKNLDGFSARHEHALKRVQTSGGRVVASYAMYGPYDFVVILDCPNEKVALRILLEEAKRGNIRYETYLAVPTQEFATVVLAAGWSSGSSPGS